MMAASPSSARPWNPDYKHSERERWICIYPAYINSKKTLAQGRIVPKSKAVDNPTYAEIKDVCSATGLNLGVEVSVADIILPS
ncbi:Signal recognition particle 19 kDa protein [Lamellibrachia satsuma]|nr:Signal recognition particle 19 kDa protein [Lamellibrachia satsuma]